MRLSDHVAALPLTSLNFKLSPPNLKILDIAGGVAATTTLILLLRRYFGGLKNGVPLPPGPPATWFWDNPMPTTDPHRSLAALVDQYGPVVSLRRGSYVIIIVGRMDAATEIMEKEGASTVNRPHLVAAAEILSGGLRLILESSGDRFRRFRKALHTHLQPKAAHMYQDLQTETAKGVILDILNNPKNYLQHTLRYAGTVTLRIAYGKSTPTSPDDPEIVRIRQVTKNLEFALQPGAYLVDFIPWLKYVPGNGKQLKEFRRFESELYRDQLNRVRAEMANGTAGPSFGRTLVENVNDHHLSKDEMEHLAGSLFAAGADTTAVAINMIIMAAATHPEAQARVQQELDEVVGKDRLPTFEDWDMLPQLHAFIMEAHRWRPVAPQGFAHEASKDIIWRGQCIPAGATVIAAHWPISRDPAFFPDPETFNPGRWLTEDVRVRTALAFYTYGFGRRVCPGQHVANRSIYINMAFLLWSFKIVERPDAPIDTHTLGDTVVLHLAPFEVDFVPRAGEQKLREMAA